MERKTPAALDDELAQLGYTWEYLDRWQPKVDMYWHVDQLNVAGEIVGRAGQKLPNLPAHPDHQASYARRGILPWPPSKECECKACRARYGAKRTGKAFMSPNDVQRAIATHNPFDAAPNPHP